MTDKAGLLAKIDALVLALDRYVNELHAMRVPMAVFRAEQRADVTRDDRIRMSGRWIRRDGDVYGIVRQPGVGLDGSFKEPAG